MILNKNNFNLFYFLCSKNKEEINESRDMKNLIIWKRVPKLIIGKKMNIKIHI